MSVTNVAAMIRSFEFTTYAALFKQLDLGTLHEERLPQLEPWTGFWYRWVSASFLREYLEGAGHAGFLAKSELGREHLLDAMLMEKALYELRYEANNRPDWLWIPARGVLQLLGEEPA